MATDDIRKYRRIKAAGNDEVCSVNYDPLVARFVRMHIKEGKKWIAREVVIKTFEKIKLTQIEKWNNARSEEDRKLIECNPTTILHQAIDNCRPLLTTEKIKRGGVTYTVPVPVMPNYQIYKAMKWIMEAASVHEKDTRVWISLANELIAASKNEGIAVRKKQDLHKICEANRAYAHYRWT